MGGHLSGAGPGSTDCRHGYRRTVGACVGDSVASVNITFFSSHDLQSGSEVRSGV